MSSNHDPTSFSADNTVNRSSDSNLYPRIPPALEWVYQPPKGGMDSRARHYRGFDAERRARLLRPARPIKLDIAEGDLVTLTNTDGGTPVLLLTFGENGDYDFHSLDSATILASSATPTNPTLKISHTGFAIAGGI